MVCKVEDCGKLRGQEYSTKSAKNEQREAKSAKQQPASLLCNKGGICKFKRSCSGEDDAISSAILLLACVVCNPSFM